MKNFELVRTEQVEELNTLAKIYRHIPTGAEILSMETDDENKCFGVAVRTPPSDSTGVAHILEHTVLCGSRKYPVKDPFVQLLKGSLQTFLNAITYPDKTCYPVARQNLKDFYNL
nr:insulinase family protein [Spirochaetales bacterium]